MAVIWEEGDDGEKVQEREYFGWVDRMWEECEREGESVR